MLTTQIPAHVYANAKTRKPFIALRLPFRLRTSVALRGTPRGIWMRSMRVIRICLIATAMGAALIGKSAAQSWPSRTITVISGFGAGSGVDVLARDIAKAMSNELHQPVIVEDRPGANGNIAAAATAKAAPDG